MDHGGPVCARRPAGLLDDVTSLVRSQSPNRALPKDLQLTSAGGRHTQGRLMITFTGSLPPRAPRGLGFPDSPSGKPRPSPTCQRLCLTLYSGDREQEPLECAWDPSTPRGPAVPGATDQYIP